MLPHDISPAEGGRRGIYETLAVAFRDELRRDHRIGFLVQGDKNYGTEFACLHIDVPNGGSMSVVFMDDLLAVILFCSRLRERNHEQPNSAKVYGRYFFELSDPDCLFKSTAKILEVLGTHQWSIDLSEADRYAAFPHLPSAMWVRLHIVGKP